MKPHKAVRNTQARRESAIARQAAYADLSPAEKLARNTGPRALKKLKTA